MSGEKTIQARVYALYKSDGQHVYGRSEFILNPSRSSGLPVVWYGAIHVDGPLVAAMQRALFADIQR